MSSVRGDRYPYRDVERDDRTEPQRRTYTTVKRYQVPDVVNRALRDDETVKDDRQVVIRRRRESSPSEAPSSGWKVKERTRELPREEVDFKFTERIRERETVPMPQRRDISYRAVERDDFDRRSRSDYRSNFRERETVKAPSPPAPETERVREYRFERERSFSPARQPQRQRASFDVERYVKETDYYQQPAPAPAPAPAPIIIRESAPAPIIIREERREPIIIREERREPHYEFIEREEVRDETRSLVKSEPPPAPVASAPSVVSHKQPEPEENYYYERRVIERDRNRPRRDDDYDRRSEVRPRDSASQWSEDSYEYVRKERTYEDSRSRSRSRSPHHKRHLAEGAIAGVGAAELLRHHRQSRGENVGGRGSSALAGAAVGAIGAEAVSRIRSRSRRRRSRSRSSSYDDYDRRPRRRGRSRSSSSGRSRSKSRSRAKTLGGIAAVAAVGALAGYALKKRGENKETVIIEEAPRRSRSRRRRASVDSYYTDDRSDMATNPEHRNKVIAGTGLASAAAAGLWQRVRSKSRGGRSRSKSRIREGVPVAAAGLGGAALAGLYENMKAKRERSRSMGPEGSRRRSRSRSRSVPARYPVDDRYVDDRPMIAYGHEPVYAGGPGPRGYYSDDEPGLYRRRGGSSGSSPDTRRRSRSRSRSRHLAETGAAAAAAAAAGHELGKRRERSRQRSREESRERSRRREDEPPYGYGDRDPVYSPAPEPEGYLPPQHPYGNRGADYPGGTYFPPPPTNEYAHAHTGPREAPAAEAYPAYNPADYARPGAADHGPYGAPYTESNVTLGAPYPNDTFAGDPRYAAPREHSRSRDPRGPADVSASELQPAATDAPAASKMAESEEADGVKTPRPAPPTRSRSQSRVRFDLDANTMHSPEQRRRQLDGGDWTSTDTSRSSNERTGRSRRKPDEERGRPHRRHSTGLMHDKYEDQPESDSEGTIDLPPRFDEHGNRRPENDALADSLNKILGEVGFTEFLGRLAGEDEGRGHSDRRRRRH